MGLFSKILPALEVVGGVALEFVPGMQLAGAMLITQGVASSGLIGGSVGKFLNSDLAKGLMAAVSIGSIAYGMYGSAASAEASAAGAGSSSSADAVAAGQASNQAVTADLSAGGADAPAATGSAMSTTVGYNLNQAMTPASAAAGGMPAGAPPPLLDATGSQITEAQQVQQTAQAVSPGANAAVAPNASGAQSTTGTPGQVAGANASATPDTSSTVAGAPSNEGHQAFESAEGNPAPEDTGMLGKAAGLLNTRGGAAAIGAAGSLLGGIGGGISAQAAMDKQIAAQQYPMKTFENPQNTAAIANAAAAPVTVPQGYLQRAQALKGMLGTTAGIQPAGGSNPAGGPVPVWQMSATPRGGVVPGAPPPVA